MEVVQDIIRHLLRVVMNLIRLIVQSRGAVSHGMEQICPRPVEHRHEIIADDLYSEPGQIPYRLDIIGDIPVPAGQPYLDVVMDIHGLHHIHVEAIRLQGLLHLRDLLYFPDFPRHLVMQRPHDAGHAGNLPDVRQLDVVIALAVPAKAHLHSHIMIPLLSSFSLQDTAVFSPPCPVSTYNSYFNTIKLILQVYITNYYRRAVFLLLFTALPLTAT